MRTEKPPSWEIHKAEKFTYFQTEDTDRREAQQGGFSVAVHAHSSTEVEQLRRQPAYLCHIIIFLYLKLTKFRAVWTQELKLFASLCFPLGIRAQKSQHRKPMEKHTCLITDSNWLH